VIFGKSVGDGVPFGMLLRPPLSAVRRDRCDAAPRLKIRGGCAITPGSRRGLIGFAAPRLGNKTGLAIPPRPPFFERVEVNALLNICRRSVACGCGNSLRKKDLQRH
jgi:hypothetical protein